MISILIFSFYSLIETLLSLLTLMKEYRVTYPLLAYLIRFPDGIHSNIIILSLSFYSVTAFTDTNRDSIFFIIYLYLGSHVSIIVIKELIRV